MKIKFQVLMFTVEIFALDIDPADGDVKVGIRLAWKRSANQ